MANLQTRGSAAARGALPLASIPPPRAAAADSGLPPGRRDASGFWFPARYDAPADLFTPRQRRLQARQRVLQRGRRALTPSRVSD